MLYGNVSTYSPAYSNVSTPEPTVGSNTTTAPSVVTIPICQLILLQDIYDSRVRVWDCVIFIPNLLFLVYLGVKMPASVTKLRSTSSPIFLAFHVMVCLVALTSVLRGVVSMTINATIPAADITDKVLWLALRFFLLTTEMSVVIFGLLFGHLDSRTSIRRVLLVTSFISLAYSSTQGTLEFIHADDNVFSHTVHRNYSLFGHGGMIFWFTTSILFFVVYTCITIIPFTSLRRQYSLPTKRAFYFYCAFLSMMNLATAVGSYMLYANHMEGMCVVDVTTYLYFTGFAPLVYITFLREYFRRPVSMVSISYSYTPQVNETGAGGEDDFLTMPHHSHSSKSTTLPSPVGGSVNYDSTQFASNNPLYFSNSHSSSYNHELSINRDYFDE